jgi:hypothetical protein
MNQHFTIYHVYYLDSDDTTKHHYFSSKQEASKLYNKMKKMEKQQFSDEDSSEQISRIQVFDISEMKAEVSKTGILNLLNFYFSET